MKNPEKEAFRWLEQADHDFLVCQWNLEGGVSDTCFVAQQCAEKALKAFLYFTGERIVHGHSVVDLAERCASFDGEFAGMSTEAILLDRFYIACRYPNALPGSVPYKVFVVEDGENAIAACGRILSAVEKRLNPPKGG